MAAVNPFRTPSNLSAAEKNISISSVNVVRRRFQRQLLVGEYEKPWLKEKKDPRERLPNLIFAVFIVLGICAAAVVIYFEITVYPNSEYCLVMEDQFQNMNSDNWNQVVSIDGFNYESFDWTTDDPKNSYVDAEGLHIVPTLTTETTNITTDQIYDGYTLNLTNTRCIYTGGAVSNATCVIISNYTSGSTIPPVRSARLTTAGKHSITYGRVEVVAKMIKGDWLYPSITMLPENGGVYGAWPISGEISIASFRANGAQNYSTSGVGGIDTLRSILNWGVSTLTNEGKWDLGKHVLRRTDYSKKFHTYGLEWSPNYIFTYVDMRLVQVFTIKFPKGTNLYDRGGFKTWTKYIYGTVLANPWSQTGNANTPFDQPFYLDLNVAVGARNGYFPDFKCNKPWTDGFNSAVRDFALTNGTWYPTWETGSGMLVRNVKMYSLGKCTK